jgi:hypothetical protein
MSHCSFNIHSYLHIFQQTDVVASAFSGKNVICYPLRPSVLMPCGLLAPISTPPHRYRLLHCMSRQRYDCWGGGSSNTAFPQDVTSRQGLATTPTLKSANWAAHTHDCSLMGLSAPSSYQKISQMEFEHTTMHGRARVHYILVLE